VQLALEIQPRKAPLIHFLFDNIISARVLAYPLGGGVGCVAGLRFSSNREVQMHGLIQRRRLIVGAISAVAVVSGASSVMAAPKIYKYRCPKCKLIQEYGSPGVKKCPNDGKTMVRQN
jgi:hypothetical protein